ncbi:hypothetical protein HS1genome_0489 [Sulfodiicoccus acidiphilus]|uniref:Uncharacterized protein n=1 Tax=Sulfodiicoccus acidiphilus TaxID=1670455 RepID=A0A348B1P8_9CREN|nr:hypothetical protein HS1genome_0489 [Sulfodiicoccus acidiphilus]GGT94957.1 hypothetical protein GCM10007116_10730 [Sulfodiicoccus acidiphilus]
MSLIPVLEPTSSQTGERIQEVFALAPTSSPSTDKDFTESPISLAKSKTFPSTFLTEKSPGNLEREPPS